MSKHASSTESTGESEPLETALEALQSSPEFRGPVEPLDDHEHVHENDHFALIYESQAEQFAAAIPFIRQGLERDERCLYITYENSREEVIAAMRDYGIDVDTALDSGQLSIHDEEETYLRNETFDANETVEFIDAAVEEASEEYEALRMTGEMSSVLTEDPEGEELIRCEAKANYLFDEVDGIALCQYNRNTFSADIIRDVISTHPLLIHNDRVSHNVYYTPPEEFFGPEKTEREVNRLLRTLQNQTDAKAELQRREQYLLESYEITSDPALTFDEKLQALFELGCEQFDLTLGAMAKVDPDKDQFEIEYVSNDHPYFEPGLELPLSETYCTAATDNYGVGSVDDPVEAGYDDIHVHEEFGIKAYLGTHIEVEGDVNRTFFFVSEESRDRPFTDGEHTFQRLMGQWVKYELERQQRERDLRERTEHLNALIESTPECIKTVASDGTLLQMNDAGLEMVEAPEESAVIGENVYDLIAPEHRDRFREFNERVCQGERGTLGFDIIGIEGTRRHMESHAAPLERPDGTVQVALTRDITEQKERKRELDETITELQESEERLRLALEAGEMGTWELDLQSGDAPVRSPQHDRIFGYEEPLDDWSFETFLDHVHPNDRERVEQRFEEALETGKWDFECWITGADGEQRAISAQGEFYHDSDEEPIRAVGVVQDITERKQAEEKLQKSKEQFRALVTASSDVVYRMSPDWNEMHELEGKDFLSDTDEPTSDWVEKYIHPDDRQRVMDAIDEAIRTESVFEFEHRVEQDDGSIGWTHSRAVPMLDEDGEIDEWVGMASDITERKERERELERVERQFEAAFNNPSAFVGLLDPDGTVRRINDTALEFAGIDEADVQGEKFWETPWFDHSERLQAELRDGVERAADGEYVRAEIPHRSPDGEIAIMDSMLEPVRDEDGAIVAVVPSGHDITERKEYERDLEQYKTVAETASDVILTIDDDGRIQNVNPAVAEVFGYEPAALEGESLTTLMPDRFADDHRAGFEQYLQTGDRTLEWDYIELPGVRADGTEIPLAISFSEYVYDGDHYFTGIIRDITERREREAELRQTKDRFETVFEQSDDGIFILDPDADEFVDANPAAAAMTGYTRDELLSLAPPNLHPDEMEQFRAFLDEARKQGSAWSEDLHCRHKDGRDIPAEITASAITLDGRDLVLTNVRPIGERKKHERYQRELYEIIADTQASFDEKLDRLLELGRERFDLENGYFNRVDADDHEFEVVEAVGPHDRIEPGAVDSLEGTYCETHLSLTEPLAVADVVDAGLDDLRAHDQYGLEAYFAATVHVGGHEYGTLCFASETQRNKPFTEAERTFLDLMGQCISYELEHRRRERFLHESHTITADSERGFEAKLEELLDLGREWMNLDAAGLTHLPSWDDKFLNEITIGYGDETDELWTDPGEGCYCRQAVDADEPVGMADIRGTDWEDDEIYQEHGLTCYLGTKVMNGSTPYGTVWVGGTEPRDREFTETERTFLELIGQWVSYEIEREYRERELKESNERLEQFAYAASHDLQEPLRMVSSYLQLLDRRYSDAFDEDGEEYLEFAVDGADRMREMIDGLLAYSRVETRGDPFEPVELDAVLDDVLEDLQLQIEETDAEITSEELPCVEGDANQLRQVFQNLLENAITYSGSTSPDVHIETKRRKQEWVISVHDSGIGIDPDNQDRIFNIFDRLHSRDEYEGTGLGLALCQRIVERHEGEIWVESEPGDGSTFSFTLPMAHDQ